MEVNRGHLHINTGQLHINTGHLHINTGHLHINMKISTYKVQDTYTSISTYKVQDTYKSIQDIFQLNLNTNTERVNSLIKKSCIIMVNMELTPGRMIPIDRWH